MKQKILLFFSCALHIFSQLCAQQCTIKNNTHAPITITFVYRLMAAEQTSCVSKTFNLGLNTSLTVNIQQRSCTPYKVFVKTFDNRTGSYALEQRLLLPSFALEINEGQENTLSLRVYPTN